MTTFESQLVTEEMKAWWGGKIPDAMQFVAAHPSIAEHESHLLDLACGEYCVRRSRGEQLTPETFARKFSKLQSTIVRLLRIEEFQASRSPDHPRQIAWPKPGDIFHGFRLESELGRGAFSRVFSANELELGERSVVVKLSWTTSREAYTLGLLKHPNIVPVYSAQNLPDGLTLVCMPHLGTATLRNLIDGIRAGMSRSTDTIRSIAGMADQQSGRSQTMCRGDDYERVILRIAIQLADALAYVHSLGILHCDLKPSNVLLARDGTPMLLDFNLSLDVNAVASRLGGTLPYMSPEHIEAVFLSKRSSAELIGRQSDIYSLGVVLYELLTGSLPYAENEQSTGSIEKAKALLKQQAKGPVSIDKLISGIDPRFENAISRCLEVDASRRPRGGEELASEFRSLAGNRRRVQRWLVQHPWRASVCSVAATALVALASVWLVTLPPAAVRAFNSGLSAYTRGDFDRAANHFQAAVSAGASTPDVHFARGMANVRLGDIESAVECFRAAYRRSERPEIAAMLAYCSAMQESFRNSTYYGKKTVEFGFSNSSVLNNLGYAQYKLGQLGEALATLDKAILVGQNQAEPFRNRALVRFGWSLRGDQSIESAISDVERAIALAPDDGQLHYDAGIMYGYASLQDATRRLRAIELAKKAIDLGVPRDTVLGATVLAQFRADLDGARKPSRPPTSQPLLTARRPPLVMPVEAARLP